MLRLALPLSELGHQVLGSRIPLVYTTASFRLVLLFIDFYGYDGS
jgi:hypothetical protein